MVHNAHSSKADYFLAYNNNKNMEEALVAGYRGLMLDSCICDGSIGEQVHQIFKGEDNVRDILYVILYHVCVLGQCDVFSHTTHVM